MRSRSASDRAHPMWSPCSCVTKIASICSASMPAEPRRLPSSRMPSPQSTSRCVTCVPSRAWTTVALPLLPLPRLLKRSVTCSFQVFGEQADDLLRDRRGLGRALGIEHRNDGLVALRLQRDAVLDRVRGVVAAEDLRKESAALAVRDRLHVAHEVRA